MAKSNVAHEIDIINTLEKTENSVSETDLGAYLIQLSGDESSHIVFPSLHMTREDIGRMLHKELGLQLSDQSSTEEIVAAVRQLLRKKYMEADIGISGANAISADTGSVILVENEGNIRIDTVLPPVHIIITGIDKIVPTLNDAMKEAMVQSAYAGLYPPTYVNITSGPSSTADIELKRVSPATGPKEVHVILLDNGRMEASRDEFMKEALLCIKCGRCYFACPVYRVKGIVFHYVAPLLSNDYAKFAFIIQLPGFLRYCYGIPGSCQGICILAEQHRAFRNPVPGLLNMAPVIKPYANYFLWLHYNGRE